MGTSVKMVVEVQEQSSQTRSRGKMTREAREECSASNATRRDDRRTTTTATHRTTNLAFLLNLTLNTIDQRKGGSQTGIDTFSDVHLTASHLQLLAATVTRSNLTVFSRHLGALQMHFPQKPIASRRHPVCDPGR